AEDGIRDFHVTGVQTCALPISVEIRRVSVVAPKIAGAEMGGPARWRVEVSATLGVGVSSNAPAVVPLEAAPDRNAFERSSSGIRSEERRVGIECRTRRAAGR